MTFGDPPVWGQPPPPPAPQYPPVVLPYAPTRRNKPWLVVLEVVAAFALLAGGLVYILRDTPHGPSHPKEWDPRVLDIVHFDEQHRGLTYKHPVFVDFLTPQQYSDRVRTDQSTLTDKQKADLAAGEGEFRALGLSNSSLNLLDATNQLQDNGTLAFYDPESEHVIIRGTDLTVDLRVTLIHEFTHVLQDQYFNIKSQRTDQFKTSQEDSSFRALLEGDATRIENEYIDSLSASDKADYETAHNQEVDSATTDLSDVPVALQALQSAPYLVGPPFVELLDADGGQSEVDGAFKSPPTTDEQLLDPARFKSHEPALDVKEPSLPDGVSKDKELDDGDFGALSWYIVLAERIDPLEALKAVDGWGGDSYIVFTQNGETCMRLDWQGDTADDSSEILSALTKWVAAMPAGAASVTSDGGIAHLQTCDLGPNSGITLNNRANDAIQIPAARSEFMLDAVKNGGVDFNKAFEYGNCTVSEIGFDNFVAADKAGDGGLPPDVQKAIQDASTDCINKVGG